MRICVGANVLLIVFCLGWLWLNWQKTAPPFIVIALSVMAGYFISDILSGLIHWAADTWFYEEKIGRAMSILREHHSHPQHIMDYGFLDHASFGSGLAVFIIGPIIVCITQLPLSAPAFIGMMLCLELCICLLFLSSLHKLGHYYSKFAIVRFFQTHRFLVSPKYHAVHHNRQTIRYCVINGWTNYLLDRYLVWRWLERIIKNNTGVIPREDDEAWQKRFHRYKP